MFKKIVLAAVAASTSVLFFAACGGNDCQDAADKISAKLKSCNITASSTSSSSGSSGDCTAELGKQAQALAACTDTASCDALTGKDLTGAQTYAKCILDAAGSSTSATSGGTTSATTSTGTGG